MAAKSKQAIESINDDPPRDLAYFKNVISQAVIDFYYEQFGADSTEKICKLKQNSWVAACRYARQYIKRDDLLVITEHIARPPGGITYNETYNEDLIAGLCHIYIDLSFLYDKVPSVFGFLTLTGISRQALYNWLNAEKVTPSFGLDTKKKAIEELKLARKTALENTALSVGAATVGAVACLNNEYWNIQGGEDKREAEAVQAVALPVFNTEAGGLVDRGELPALPVVGVCPSSGVSVPVDASGLPVF